MTANILKFLGFRPKDRFPPKPSLAEGGEYTREEYCVKREASAQHARERAGFPARLPVRATAREHDYIVARQIGGVFMKVALIGVTGAVGSRVAKELLARNHTVTGISRHPETASKIDGVAYKAGDVADKNTLAKLFSGHDAVISSVRFLDSDPRTLIDAVKQSGVKRYLVVGGAGTLELQPGLSVLDAGKVPEAHVAEVRAGKIFLDMIRAENNLDWSFLSPSSMLMPGQRTGKFRLGGDALLRDDSGKSHISMEDLAVALVDELEQGKHIKRRFTAGY
jgi:putative NADH-flavin reductase